MEKDISKEEVKKFSSALTHIIDIIFTIKVAFTELYNDCNCRKGCDNKHSHEISDGFDKKK